MKIIMINSENTMLGRPLEQDHQHYCPMVSHSGTSHNSLNNNPNGLNNPSPSTTNTIKPKLITLNVTGLKFQTWEHTLSRYPDTLLGNANRRKEFWDEENGVYFFDQHRGSFKAILYAYQSYGRLKRPHNIPLDIFLKELKFFDMNPELMNRFWRSEGYVKADELPMPTHPLAKLLVLSSAVRRVVACLGPMLQLRERVRNFSSGWTKVVHLPDHHHQATARFSDVERSFSILKKVLSIPRDL